MVQALQQHLFAHHKDQLLAIPRFIDFVKINSFDDNIQRRATIATIPYGAICTAVRTGHDELHTRELAWKVAFEHVAQCVSRSLHIPERILTGRTTPNAVVTIRLQNTWGGQGGCQEEMPLLQHNGVKAMSLQASWMVRIAFQPYLWIDLPGGKKSEHTVRLGLHLFAPIHFSVLRRNDASFQGKK